MKTYPNIVAEHQPKISANDRLVIFGGGLVGTLLAVYLAKRGFQVDVYEKRKDSRKHKIDGGRSINLALSERGWRGLAGVGLEEAVRDCALPMEGRIMHDVEGMQTFQPYGTKDQAIYSVSRSALNVTLIAEAAKYPNLRFHFDTMCMGVDHHKGEAYMSDDGGKTSQAIFARAFFGADGAYSVVRNSLMKTERFNYQQHFIEHGYKELSILPSKSGDWQLDPNGLHIWPRKSFMLIALPNPDKSFTCTLFFPFAGSVSFSKLKGNNDVKVFFEAYFPDVIALMPDYQEQFFQNITSSLVTIKCFPWSLGNFCLIGDAAHAIVPFFGQGMNCGFEDCRIFNSLIEENKSWEELFEQFQSIRKPDADAISELAMNNFVEMRDLVADPKFLIRKKVEARLHALFPEYWQPLYTLVSFTNTPYHVALQKGKAQEKVMQELMEEGIFNKPWIDDEVLEKVVRKHLKALVKV